MMKSTMTETVLSSDHGGTAAAMAQNAQMTEEHSSARAADTEKAVFAVSVCHAAHLGFTV